MENLVWDSRAPPTAPAAAPTVPTVLNAQHHSSVDNKRWPKELSKDNCNTIFSFLEQYSVLVCKQHCTAIINLDRHLRE